MISTIGHSPLNSALVVIGITVLTTVASADARSESTQGAVTAGACGSLKNHYGPFDYLADQDKLGIVEQYHFTPGVESLVRGQSGSVEGDLDYTLRAFPNHARALVALTRLIQRRGGEARVVLPLPVGCYFERALRFRPDDVVVRMLFANYLIDSQRGSEAKEHLDYVRLVAGDNPLTYNNLGLLYLKIDRVEDAALAAETSRRLGFDTAELNRQLQSRGFPADAQADGKRLSGAAVVAPAASAP